MAGLYVIYAVGALGAFILGYVARGIQELR